MKPRHLVALHRQQAEALGSRPALRERRHGLFRDLSWDAYYSRTCAAAAALIDAGIQPGDRVGILAENRTEWLIADMAILAAGAINVPPHAPLTARQVYYQFEQTGICWLFVSTPQQLQKFRAMPGKLPSLRGVVGFSVADDDVQSWDAFLSRGQHALLRLRAELARREELLTCDDLATIMFTSGTTGEPKGVMLTHGNLLSNATASLELSPRAPDAVVLSWLPYTHIYARTIDHYGCLVSGSLLCLAGSAETLIDDLAEVRPTNFASVPRFYEKVLSAQTDAAPSKRADRLRRVFGDRLDWMSSGGAPLPVGIARAYLDAGLPLLQGYGLTETSPVISFNTKEHHRLGSVGRALPGVDVRIADDGEILTRGPHVMRGYWQDADATAAAIRDGWFHTGDLGSLDADGYLFITGRKKELMVLSNGKKVVPSYLEGLLLTDPCFDQVMICGEGRNFISALVVPHWANVAAALHWDAGKSALPTERRAELPEVQQLLEERANRASADVASFEQVRKIAILPQPFTVAADELTVSLKLRRAVILEHYAARIEAIYQEVTNFGKCMDS